MFISDFKFGIEGEKQMVELLCKGKKEPIVIHSYDTKNTDWDFIIDDISYECKTDRMAHRTNNLAVEVACKNKASGLTTSKADYWIFNLDKMDFIIIIKADELRELIKDVKKIRGGDKWRCCLHLLPIKDIPEKNKYKRDEIIELS